MRYRNPKSTLSTRAIISLFVVLAALALPPAAAANASVFAIVGDYGTDDSSYEGHVAEMVFSWDPEFILTVGDNNYLGDWNKSTYDEAVGQYYCRFMYPTPDGRTHDWKGVDCESISHSSGDTNFYPTPGNHDWSQDDDDDEEGYLGYQNYFEPASGQTDYDAVDYYTFSRSGVNFFGINSNCLCQSSSSGGGSSNCDGKDYDDFSDWLNDQLSASTASNWNVIYFHHPPYNSGHHGDCDEMDFVWDAILANNRQNNTLVVSGHEHQYQRILMDQNGSNNKVLFLIDGLSGDHSANSSSNQCCTKTITPPSNGTLATDYCYIKHKGALKVIVDSSGMIVEYYYRDMVGDQNTAFLLDSCKLTKTAAPTCVLASNQDVHNCLN